MLRNDAIGRAVAVLGLSAGFVFIVPAMSVRADECAAEPVFASGEPASYEWLARIKTHANWRAIVRSMPELGDAYANWERAEDVTERCFSGPAGTVCNFSGRPCRKD